MEQREDDDEGGEEEAGGEPGGLRRGKWSVPEQDYAKALISAFLEGLMPGVTDGTTLRAFLAQKLNCAPMRITKKLAGATLGKAAFHRRGYLTEELVVSS